MAIGPLPIPELLLTITSFFSLSTSLFSLYFSTPSLISLTFSNPSRHGRRRHLIHSDRPPSDLILSYLTFSNPSRRRRISHFIKP